MTANRISHPLAEDSTRAKRGRLYHRVRNETGCDPAALAVTNTTYHGSIKSFWQEWLSVLVESMVIVDPEQPGFS